MIEEGFDSNARDKICTFFTENLGIEQRYLEPKKSIKYLGQMLNFGSREPNLDSQNAKVIIATKKIKYTVGIDPRQV